MVVMVMVMVVVVVLGVRSGGGHGGSTAKSSPHRVGTGRHRGILADTIYRNNDNFGKK